MIFFILLNGNKFICLQDKFLIKIREKEQQIFKKLEIEIKLQADN